MTMHLTKGRVVRKTSEEEKYPEEYCVRVVWQKACGT
jgi:hypothetical protein